MLLVVGREIAAAKSVGKQASSQLWASMSESHLPLIIGHWRHLVLEPGGTGWMSAYLVMASCLPRLQL